MMRRKAGLAPKAMLKADKDGGNVQLDSKDPTIREKFNTYRFAGHKGEVIDLLMRVTRVSVETMAIINAMQAESPWGMRAPDFNEGGTHD